MKYIYSTLLLAVAMLIGSANVQAQKRVSLGDGKNAAATLLVPDNANTKVINEHQAMVSFGSEPKNLRHEDRATHNFSINIADGDWQEIHVACGDDYLFDMMIWEGDGYNEVVEEGYYDIFIIGFNENGDMCALTYDQVPVFDDVEFNATFNDCIYAATQSAFGSDGTDLSTLDYMSNDYLVYFRWLNGKWGLCQQFLWCPEYFTEFPMYFSGCDERSYVSVVSCMHTSDQIEYNINYPYVRGISDNFVVENIPELLVPHTEEYLISDAETSYCHMDYVSFWDEQNYIGNLSWTVGETFDPHQSWTMYTDGKWGTESSFTEHPVTSLLPAVYEYYHDSYNWPPYENYLAPFGFYLDAEGKIMREPFGQMRIAFNYGMPNYVGFFPETPVTTHVEPGTTLYFGERTPMTYSRSYVLTPDQGWSGAYAFQPFIASIGENGCVRICDKDAVLKASFNGEEIFNDSIFKISDWDEFQIETPGVVTFEIDNNHLVANNVQKSNITRIEFDLNNDDICAPTMTFLQVKDAYNHECIELTNLSQSTICLAAGDFSPHYTEEGGYGHFDCMQYDGKPSVEVFYSIDGNTWEAMETGENENLFHENYGNVFTIDLAQLDGKVNNNWISLKFALTDEAGNSQTQELSNVFFAGHMTSVSEAQGLTHSVYPNPFSSKVRINATEAVNGNANVSVYNILGEQVISKAMQCNGTTEFVIDGSSLMSGIYFYSISTENGMMQGRIVKE